MAYPMHHLSGFAKLESSEAAMVVGHYHRCDLFEVEGLHQLELGVFAHHHEDTLGDHQDSCLASLVVPQGHVEGK